MGRVTLAEVARYAGVSSAVVSYVVNDGPRPVAPGTAERVRKAIDTLGYRPNSSARALRTGRTGIVGLVLPPTSNPFFGEYADALYQAADAAGIALLAAGSGGSVPTESAAIATLGQRELDGLIIATSITPGDVSSLRLPALPLVLIDCPFPVAGFSTIGPASADGAQALVEHLLLQHHHTRVGFIGGDDGSQHRDPRHDGWVLAHHRNGRTPGMLQTSPYSREGGYHAAQAVLQAGDGPTALLVGSDLQADGVLRAIDEAGRRIPDDIALVSFDGTGHSAFTTPPLTVARQPIAAMAAAAVATVLSGEPPTHQLFSMQTELRASCGCPAQSSPVSPTEAVAKPQTNRHPSADKVSA